MTKDEAIRVTANLLCAVFDPKGEDYTKVAIIRTAEADKNIDALCSALDKLIEFCEKLKKVMYNQI